MKYDADYMIHWLAVAKEVAEAVLGGVMLFAGINLWWIIGCALG